MSSECGEKVGQRPGCTGVYYLVHGCGSVRGFGSVHGCVPELVSGRAASLVV